MSKETMRYRTWILGVESMGKADFLWLKGLNIDIRIDAPMKEFDSFGGQTHRLHGKPMYTCDTTTDKQRDMLILKYGNDAILLAETVVLPNTMTEAVLKEVSW